MDGSKNSATFSLGDLLAKLVGHPIAVSSPCQFKLSEPNIVAASVIIASRTKLDKLWFFRVSEAQLDCPFKTVDDFIEIFQKDWFGEEFYSLGKMLVSMS